MASAAYTVIILAAGKGERFLAAGGAAHKLDSLLAGKPVLQHVVDTVAASGLRWHLVRPDGGTAGMGDSIALGVKSTSDAEGWLILPGDLPLVRAESLQRVAQALASSGRQVVMPHYQGKQGHPVGFGRECLADLVALSGDVGASAVVRAARRDGKVLDLQLDDPGICLDVDTPNDLREAQRLLR